eukprot:gene20166-22141_t
MVLTIKYEKLKNQLQQKFTGGQLKYIGEGTPAITGYLEVSIQETGEVLHSKKNGDGYIDSDAKLNKIIAGIEKALAKA